jgi:dTDP-4-amino-4,6-dideoxygalactose transaminase
MGSFQKRTGLAEIDRLAANSAHRSRLSRYYARVFWEQGWPVHVHTDSPDTALLRFPLEVKNKISLLEASSQAGIEIGSWFETPLHPLSLADHRLMDYRLGSCPVAESTASKVINLPLHERVTRGDAESIARFVLSHASPASSRGARLLQQSVEGARTAI